MEHSVRNQQNTVENAEPALIVSLTHSLSFSHVSISLYLFTSVPLYFRTSVPCLIWTTFNRAPIVHDWQLSLWMFTPYQVSSPYLTFDHRLQPHNQSSILYSIYTVSITIVFDRVFLNDFRMNFLEWKDDSEESLSRELCVIHCLCLGFVPSPPLVNIEPRYVEAIVGQNVDVRCSAEGNPPPRIEWVYPGSYQYSTRVIH